MKNREKFRAHLRAAAGINDNPTPEADGGITFKFYGPVYLSAPPQPVVDAQPAQPACPTYLTRRRDLLRALPPPKRISSFVEIF